MLTDLTPPFAQHVLPLLTNEKVLMVFGDIVRHEAVRVVVTDGSADPTPIWLSTFAILEYIPIQR